MSEHPHSFSKRTAWDLAESDHSVAVARAKAAGNDLLDLTISNPTACGFQYDVDAVLGPLADRAAMRSALTYRPDSTGMRSAREAVSQYYADHHADVRPGQLVLTTSTSEAYSYLFRLLCDAGDEVLVAQPSYPLFDFLADLDDVRLTPFPLFYDFGWWIDFAELERHITPRTRAVLLVHPNNPTGHWTHRVERESLEALCVKHRLALIVDEVFLDYPLNDRPEESFATGPHFALTFILSGISKVAALPQMKVAWLAALGPEHAVSDALARLEVIADTFLSMNAPAQLAVPRWMAGRGHIQRQIAERTRKNLALLLDCDRLHVRAGCEAGWSAVARLATPWGQAAQQAAAVLLEQAGLIVHPGSFYGTGDRRTIVLSLLTPLEVMRQALERLCNISGA